MFKAWFIGIVLAVALAASGCSLKRVADAPEPEIVHTDPETGMAPAVPGPWRHDPNGPPRPPSRDELIQVDGLPDGESLIGGLPGTNVQVNQDTSTEPQNETSIEADPSNSQILVGMWNDYFNVNPGQNTVIGYGWTSDGGQTWQSGRVDFSTLPADQSTGDPAVAADSTGIFYMAILAYSGSANGILVSRSLDSGATWQEPVRLDNGGDKEYITTDLSNDNVYVVWENVSINGQTIYFSKSTDQGVTYTARQPISGPASTGNGAYPVVGPNGEIYVIWTNFGNTIYFDRSLDEGNTWLSTDRIVSNTIDAPRSPLQGGFRNPQIPALAVDATAGPFSDRIYAVWGDERFSGDPDIAISYSDDKGDTWSAPMRVNDDVIGNDADQFFAWVEVDANGHVHVTYLDRRDDPDGLLFAMYLSTSTDGGVTFGPSIRVSDGIYGPTGFGFLGDYTGSAITGDNRIVPLWPDGRFGDEDAFIMSVPLDDYDEDGILNDGDADGQYASNRCTAGQTVACDDNCPGTPNVMQVDGDGDLVGDLCDNCPLDANTDQFDVDRDGFGDACDDCPGVVGGDGSDPDLDGLPTCQDNCPNVANVLQEDGDGDGIGDPCDVCPNTALNDDDNDGFCGDVDNCLDVSNPRQLDSDGDLVGDLCDVCPQIADPAQADSDGDGSGDLCDCQSSDGNDRAPGAVTGLTVDLSGTETVLDWGAAPGADAYSVTRGLLSSLTGGSYGDCIGEGVFGTGFNDPAVPPVGDGYLYLVQGQNFDCGLGPPGYDSNEIERSNGDPGACGGQVFTDDDPDGDTAVDGTVTGSFLDTQVSDDVYQSIEEVISQGGNPANRFSFLEHRWNLNVTPGSRIELHVEGFRTASSDGDGFAFEYSTDGGSVWTPISLPSLPTADNDTDLVALLPGGLSGSVIVRVVDTNRGPGGQFLDTVSIDQLFIRSVP
jgi:hypothetical protein